jgi:acetoin utilization deacetylase AcuC-like enzyme
VGLYLRHPLSLEHDTGPHPENADRIRAIEERLDGEGWHGLELVEAPAADLGQVERVHPREHIEAIERLAARGGGMIDLDTAVSARSYDAALRAAGGAAHAAGSLLDGERFAFCGLRPPGHHAERAAAMGFCLFNNIAIGAAEALAAGADRVMVVDWDVHHGNGTQDIFYEDDRVLFASIHQSPLYPGTGAVGETGRGAGEGYTINLPVPPGSGPDLYLSLVGTVLVPVLESFQPDLLCISAGYDAHREDPLAQCMLETSSYAEMAAHLRDAAARAGIGVLVCLEGGYALRALADSAEATIRAFTDPGVEAPPAQAQPAASYRERLRERWSLG